MILTNIPYGQEFTFTFPVVLKDDTDFADTGDYTPAAEDVQISKDGGTAADVSSAPSQLDFAGLSKIMIRITLSDTEMEAEEIAGVVSATEIEDSSFLIRTSPVRRGVLTGTHTTTSAEFSDATKPSALSNRSLVFNLMSGEGRHINAYNSTTGVFQWDVALSSAWSDDDVVIIYPGGPSSGVDVTSISGDSTAADNLEAAFDGTGYDIGGIDVSELNSVVDDWLNDGRLDVIIDAILTDTGTTLNNKIDTVDTVVDTLTTDLATLDTVADAIKVVTDNLPNSGALTSLATAAALSTVDGVVDAIKAKTDQLTFSASGNVDANIEEINEVTVTGDGSSGDKFGID